MAKWIRARMSPLVKRLLAEGHQFIRLPDGRMKLGGHIFAKEKPATTGNDGAGHPMIAPALEFPDLLVGGCDE